MKCFKMLNDNQGLCRASPPMSPRISFSNDFAVEPPTPSSPAASDQDFEFAVGGRPMTAADELFFKGRMLPLLDPPPAPVSSSAITPLDEVPTGDGEPEGRSRPHKVSLRWKEFFGLRWARNSDKADATSAAAVETPAFTTQEQKGNDGAKTANEDVEISLPY